MVDPENHVNNYFMLYEYLNHIKSNPANHSLSVIPDYHIHKSEESIKAILPEAYHQYLSHSVNMSLFELVQETIRIFSLNQIRGEQAFLLAFKDLIIDYTSFNSSGIPAFLNYWDETGSQKAIPATELQNAIRILTIHKSKGLEFGVVILPFCNWKIDQPNTVLWCQPMEKPFNKLDILPVDYSKALKETIFAGDYYEERLKTYTDNLNLLYVAFTRAREALYCFAQEDNRKSDRQVNNISHLISRILKTEKPAGQDIRTRHSNGIRIFENGFPETQNRREQITGKSHHIEDYPENNTIDRMKITYHAREYLETDDMVFHPLSYGKIMHDLFSRIYTYDDIESAIENLYYQGKIGDTEKEVIRKDMISYFSDIQVRSWFSGEWKVLNERDILTKSAQDRRPDRVLIQNRSAVIIDYKFGDKELNEHKKQVLEYADLLKEMGYERLELYLWYVTKRKIIQIKQ
jgi:ATP-dependent exoDNAse (exonuclease V) beta subunit